MWNPKSEQNLILILKNIWYLWGGWAPPERPAVPDPKHMAQHRSRLHSPDLPTQTDQIRGPCHGRCVCQTNAGQTCLIKYTAMWAETPQKQQPLSECHLQQTGFPTGKQGEWIGWRESARRWISLDLTYGKSTLVLVMAWCLTPPSHYLS